MRIFVIYGDCGEGGADFVRVFTDEAQARAALAEMKAEMAAQMAATGSCSYWPSLTVVEEGVMTWWHEAPRLG